MKIPFYMTYPMQNLYQTEMEYEKDMERIKDLFPREAKALLPRIEERCDELEYEGSRIYDENPDRMMMEREIQKLYEEIKQSGDWPIDGRNRMPAEQTNEEQLNDNQMDDNQMENGQFLTEMSQTKSKEAFSLQLPKGWELPPSEALSAQWHPGPNPAPPCNDWLCGLISVLFEEEIYKRRCRYRRCHRWW